MRDDGLERVELQLTALDRHRDGEVGAGDGERDLVDDLGDDRIDLARHDARSGLAGRQIDLAESRLRARRQQAQIVADLRELDRVSLERCRERHERAGVAGRLDEIGGGLEVEPRDLTQMAEHRGGVVGMRRDSGADRGRAHVDLVQQVGVLFEPLVVLAERRREPVELLPEGHRNRILQLRATHLQHVVELDGLVEEGAAEQVELFEQREQVETEPDLDRGRIHVVGRLAAVRVVDRRQERVVALLAPGELERDVGDDLVRVHVGRGAGATLDDADDELVVVLAVDDELRGPVDEVGLLGTRARRSRGWRGRKPASPWRARRRGLDRPRSGRFEIGKFSSARAVWMPQ